MASPIELNWLKRTARGCASLALVGVLVVACGTEGTTTDPAQPTEQTPGAIEPAVTPVDPAPDLADPVGPTPDALTDPGADPATDPATTPDDAVTEDDTATQDDATTQDGTAQEGSEITIGDIADNPEAFADQLVTLRGDVGEAVSADAFTLVDPGFLTGADLLIIGSMPGIVINDGADVQATGTIQQFDAQAIGEQLGIELAEEQFVDYQDRWALVADSVTLRTGVEPVQPSVGEIELSDLLANWDQHVDQYVSIEASVVEVLNERAFTVSANGMNGAQTGAQTGQMGDTLLIIHDAEELVVTEGAMLRINGNLRIYATNGVLDGTADDATGTTPGGDTGTTGGTGTAGGTTGATAGDIGTQEIDPNLPEEIAAQYNGQPALVVESIQLTWVDGGQNANQ